MAASIVRSGPGPDAFIAGGVALLGAFLLWCGAVLLPSAAAAGHALFSRAAAPSSVLAFLAGFGAAAAGILLTLWWVLGWLCALVGCLLHRAGFPAAGTRALFLAPGPLRRLAAALLGFSLAAGSVPAAALAVPEAAAPAAPAVPSAGAAADPAGAAGPAAGTEPGAGGTADAVSPLWRPLPPQPPGGGLLTGTPRQETGQVVVAAGDTLWSLAGQQLGPGAGDAEIAALWPRWYELNRETIGLDPGLIHPGQILTAPPL
ncbi:LysM peptidoglycan-binding domain-containing protein [Arthrobacter sp. zg-Y1143]|uniref:LysM peptidoglycan-binding domain-containing protein n=1 Tax=Arthrobacter sp. zg-Y1143 TaxID=3049065 RepID=UPI0024C2C336|nr:LysM peptidoglycan-binding domain-containing protein [Arthrobacter sp. zg-Y1143]MDK1327170.1 LysM peptidoglycan-binding domain-containing protein [Arthrobacter sp. zg-Y1143]